MGNESYDVVHNQQREVFYRVKKSRLLISIALFVVLLAVVGLLSGFLSAKFEREKARSRCLDSSKSKRDAEGDVVKLAPYGSWKSPLSSQLVSSSSISFQDLRVDPTDPESVYWSELRPDQGGIKAIFSYKAGDQQPVQWTPHTMSCNSRVHEYGGGGFIVYGGVVYFVNQGDQRIYSQKSPSEQPTPLTNEGADARYADFAYHQRTNKLICIKEDHSGVKSGTRKEAENTIVIIDIASKSETTLVSGSDFYASPKISPDQNKLIWMQWSHPNMPWDDTEIYTAEFNSDLTGLNPSSVRKVIGKPGLNVMSPKWDVDGSYLYISDETDWWNIYKQGQTKQNLLMKNIDFGQPQWKLGGNLFSVNPSGDIVFMYDQLPAIIDAKSGDITMLPSDNRHASDVIFSPTGKYVYFFGNSPVTPVAIIRIEVATKAVFTVRISASLPVDTGYLTEPKKISFPTENGRSTAHGYLYLPKNKDYKAPDGTKPPLLIMAHGGPTANAELALDFEKQYYTSRGFAILDVDYRGSTGYGRKYRTSLYGNWGIYDMEDCANGASYLARDRQIVDPEKLVITGGSAGGYTTLTSLTFTNVFAAGSSHYGISDVLILMNETHKFESRYIDRLLAPGEEGRTLARARSPIYHLDQLNKPIAFFQGELDKVVPMNQAQKMFDAIKQKGLPCAFVLFKGEYHGFAKSENKQKALDGEFYFFSKLLKFEAADKGIEITIENLPSN